MKAHSFWVLLSYSPLICRHATGVYGLRGSEVPVGLVESVVTKQVLKSKVIVDYGWKESGKVHVLYRVSAGMFTTGIINIPSALKDFLQGQFTLISEDNSKIGRFVVKGKCGWGLQAFFRRRGGEPGDYLSVEFDLSDRVASVQIGDAILIDQFHERNPPVETKAIDHSAPPNTVSGGGHCDESNSEDSGAAFVEYSLISKMRGGSEESGQVGRWRWASLVTSLI